jgi:hypothetical protein
VNRLLHEQSSRPQVWPVAREMPEMTPFAALSSSASSNTMCGDLPPSSIVTRFSPRAAAS